MGEEFVEFKSVCANHHLRILHHPPTHILIKWHFSDVQVFQSFFGHSDSFRDVADVWFRQRLVVQLFQSVHAWSRSYVSILQLQRVDIEEHALVLGRKVHLQRRVLVAHLVLKHKFEFFILLDRSSEQPSRSYIIEKEKISLQQDLINLFLQGISTKILIDLSSVFSEYDRFLTSPSRSLSKLFRVEIEFPEVFDFSFEVIL